MAYYKHINYLTYDPGSEFDQTHEPGSIVPHSGIYRCTGCGHSSTNVHNHQFPPQIHHQHANVFVPIRWQLTVKSHWR
jgi:hypothetical protein